MITVRQKGNFEKLTRYLVKTKSAISRINFDKYGLAGVEALASATPVRTGLTARSWKYEVVKQNGSVAISFYNTNIQNGIPIAILLQYGHGTRNGGWVQGRDYINPSIQPIFDKLANDAWREVTKL